MAIYLPSAVTTPIVVIGAFAGWAYDKLGLPRSPIRRGTNAKRMGILMASGLIVGESLFNVALAGLIVGTNKGEPIWRSWATLSPTCGVRTGASSPLVGCGDRPLCLLRPDRQTRT